MKFWITASDCLTLATETFES